MIAFFDVDGTLLDGSSGNMIIMYMVKEHLLGWDAVWKALKYTTLYKLNVLPYQEVYRWSIEGLANQHIEEMTALLDRIYETYLLPKFFEEGRDCIRKHRKRGDFTVIATAVGEYMAEKVRAQFEVDDKICAIAPVRDGRVTTEYEMPLPYAEGKLELARSMAEERGVSLSDCYFYSDSASDLPLLAAVGHPVLVNPQWELRRQVKGKHWPVERWKEHARFPEASRAVQLSWSPEEAGRDGVDAG